MRHCLAEHFPYDYQSVMHYNAAAFAADKSVPTIVPKDHTVLRKIGQRIKISDVDQAKINSVYTPHGPVSPCKFRNRCGGVVRIPPCSNTFMTPKKPYCMDAKTKSVCQFPKCRHQGKVKRSLTEKFNLFWTRKSDDDHLERYFQREPDFPMPLPRIQRK
jgi:hypothetical protein